MSELVREFMLRPKLILNINDGINIAQQSTVTASSSYFLNK